jgi:hypothetical protein
MKKLISLSLACYIIVLFVFCKKDKADPFARFTNATWDGSFVHTTSNPSTEEPFRIQFGSKDSLVFDYLDGTLAGAYTLTNSDQKIHIDLYKGAFIMDATIKGDSLVSFENIKTGNFSFKRAYAVRPDNNPPAGIWYGAYSMASSLRINFLSASEARLHSPTFGPVGEWNNPYTHSGKMFRIDASSGYIGKYFGIIKDSVMHGSFKHFGSSPRVSFHLKKQ